MINAYAGNKIPANLRYLYTPDEEFQTSQFCLDSAGAGNAPASKRFKNGEQSRRHKKNPQPENIVHDDDARDETDGADDPAREASVSVKVGLEESAHVKNLTDIFELPSIARGSFTLHIPPRNERLYF